MQQRTVYILKRVNPDACKYESKTKDDEQGNLFKKSEKFGKVMYIYEQLCQG